MSDQLKDDIYFLLSFVPALSPEKVEEGLAPMFYVTGSYEGDVALATKTKSIIDRYGINIDDLEETEEFNDGE